MPFNPEVFASEVALNLIPSEEMPSRAQDALVDGFDGTALVRLAVLERPSGWEVDQTLQRVLEELGVVRPDAKIAGLLLAKLRARRILDTGEDPLLSLGYFHKLLLAADYESALIGLGYADELVYGGTDDDTRQAMREECENILDPQLAAKRREERKTRWEEGRGRVRVDWPYVVDSPTGRNVFRERLRETLLEDVRLLWFLVPGLLLLIWATKWWEFALIYLAVLPLFVAVIAAWRIRRTMKRECQELRWRERIDI